MKKNKIKETGTLFETNLVKIDWFKESDIKTITDLRNKYRNNFFDNQKLTLKESEKWFEKLNIPKESLLVIRLKTNCIIIGIIGWSNWNFKTKTAEFGRLIIDYKTVLKYYTKKDVRILPNTIIKGIINFGFNQMELDKIYTKSKIDNYKSIAIQKKIGLNGKKGDTIFSFYITKKEWKRK